MRLASSSCLPSGGVSRRPLGMGWAWAGGTEAGLPSAQAGQALLLLARRAVLPSCPSDLPASPRLAAMPLVTPILPGTSPTTRLSLATFYFILIPHLGREDWAGLFQRLDVLTLCCLPLRLFLDRFNLWHVES